jgi:hypothetical protein
MDPLSALFASYLELVSNTVHTHMTDRMGTELQAVVVKHRGIPVPYSYQLWRIRPQSVCGRYCENIGIYSKCTIAARSLFEQACRHLQMKKPTDWKHRKLKNMYCAAAVDYQPTQATLERSNEKTPLEAARSACNTAIAKQMGNTAPAVRKQREKAYGQYQALREAQTK